MRDQLNKMNLKKCVTNNNHEFIYYINFNFTHFFIIIIRIKKRCDKKCDLLLINIWFPIFFFCIFKNNILSYYVIRLNGTLIIICNFRHSIGFCVQLLHYNRQPWIHNFESSRDENIVLVLSDLFNSEIQELRLLSSEIHRTS